MAADTTGEREQDAGRPHRRRGRPSQATLSLLERYQAAMRDELGGLLRELEGAEPPPGLGLDANPPARVRPSLADRGRLWELAIKLGRELGSSIDPTPPPSSTPAAPRGPSRRRVDFGEQRVR